MDELTKDEPKKKAEQPEVKKLGEVVAQYKLGNLTIDDASTKIEALSGLMPEIAACFLRSIKKTNIINLEKRSNGENDVR